MNETDIHYSSGIVLRTPVLTFVDRRTYEDITFDRKGIVLDQLLKSAALSTRMYQYVDFVSRKVCGIILGGYNDCIYVASAAGSDPLIPVTVPGSHEEADLLATFNERLTKPVESEIPFYEILPVGDGDLLVIMENGFLNHITQSKIDASAFVLLCLSQLDRFKVDKRHLNKLYLDLAFIDSYHLLLKARLG